MSESAGVGRGQRIGWALDALWLLALAVYIFAGIDAAPFHGDESMLLYMSHDYQFLVQQRDVDRVLYRDPPIDPLDQELRIINGTVSKMAMGLAWDLAGYAVDDLNQPWIWGFYDPQGEWNEWTYNRAFGHMPSDGLLRAGRVSSAALLALSALALFIITRWIVPARWAAWVATGLYVTQPSVLLNGRRSMMEGAMLLGATLVILAAIGLLRAQARPNASGRARWAWALALGVAGGFALASKHTNALALAVAFPVALVEPLIRRAEGARFDATHVARLAVAGALALAVFLALNPAWWSDPLHMPERVVETRQRVIEGQLRGYGGFDAWWERPAALVDHAFFAPAQYYEVPVWQEYIGDQIADYESSALAGRGGGPVWGGLLAAAFVFGGLALAKRWRDGPALLALLWPLLIALALLVSNPLNWQRYYLPLQPGIALVAAAGVDWAVRFVWPRWRVEERA
ncbi:MAG: phospholipid carrier-dependent glycosyltransferase [Chloroflexota bacterium]